MFAMTKDDNKSNLRKVNVGMIQCTISVHKSIYSLHHTIDGETFRRPIFILEICF